MKMNNYLIGKSFQGIQTAGNEFLQSVNSILAEYRMKKQQLTETSKKFKDEGEFMRSELPPLKSKALGSIKAAQKTLSASVKTEVSSLQRELRKFLEEPVKGDALAKLRLANEFYLPLSKMEIEAFLNANEGNHYGLRVLQAVLERGHSKYQVSFRDVDEFETDLERLAVFSACPVAYDMNFHPEVCDLFRDEKEIRIRPDGTTYEFGPNYSSESLLLARGGFEIGMDRVVEMAKTWTADISTPAITRASNALRQEIEEMNQSLRAEGVSENDLEKIPDSGESSLKIEYTGDVELAKRLGQEKARGSKTPNLSDFLS